MQEVGLEAVVKGLQKFLGDLKSINRGMDEMRPQATLLQRAFSGALDVIGQVGREILNIVEFTLGQLLADAIQFVIQKLGELAQAVIDAGSEFQTLELRLQRLNFNTLIESGLDFNAAQEESIRLTQEQMTWLQKLAATTPYDSTDISNIYTLARSYGFADKNAQGLTEDITNFAAGMGLGNTEIERILVNFGQMVQLGKVTQRELNDLARGSFVPVNDVLKIMETQTGKTGGELDDFLKTTEGVNAFMSAFSSLVETRFSGATEAMAKTFQAASANALDLAKSIGGLQIVKPILDVIGAKVAGFVSVFTDNPERWDRLVGAATRVGQAFSDVVNDIFNLIPSSDSLAEGLIGGVENFADFIQAHRDDITGFFIGIRDAIRDDIVPFIRDQMIPAFQSIADWVSDNKDTIGKFFSTIGEIVSEFFSDLSGGRPDSGGSNGILDSITKFMQFVIDNKDAIVKWVEVLWSVFVVWQVLATVFNIVANIAITIVGLFLSWIAITSAVSTAMAVLGPAIAGVGAFITGVLVPGLVIIIGTIIAVLYWVKVFQTSLDALKAIVGAVIDVVKVRFQELKDNLEKTLFNMITSIRNKDWSGAGQALIQGMINGIRIMGGALIDAARNAAISAYEAAKRALGIRSPSTLFMDIGELSMEGMAIGIEKYAALASNSMAKAMQAVSAPALAMPSMTQAAIGAGRQSSVTNNNTSAYNLTVNSAGQNENVIQDFNMLQSLQG